MLHIPLRLSKNYFLVQSNRAAGEREGARPASQHNNPPQKSLDFSRLFGRSSILPRAKCLAGEAQSKKSVGLF